MSPACAPVLLLLFNRPGLARASAEALRPARPRRVYLAADGPREGRPGEAELCERARAEARAAIDWPCEVRTLLRERNLGCSRAVHGAVSWFFEQEAEGIVLEDDCVAAPGFFRFCTELLERYRDDPRVLAISGDNFIEGRTPAVPSYWFNPVFHVWGWAGWRDRWNTMPLRIDAPGRTAIASTLRAAGLSAAEVAYWAPLFDRVRRETPAAERIDSWAYPAVYHGFVRRQLSICPARNLVRNVGFGPGSTHFDGPDAGAGKSVVAAELPFPLQHPRRVAPDRRLHRLNLRWHFGVRTGVLADVAAGADALADRLRAALR